VNLGILKSKLGEYEESDELQNQCLEYRRKEYAKVNDGDTGEINEGTKESRSECNGLGKGSRPTRKEQETRGCRWLFFRMY
jgi:hypothetical protein